MELSHEQGERRAEGANPEGPNVAETRADRPASFGCRATKLENPSRADWHADRSGGQGAARHRVANQLRPGLSVVSGLALGCDAIAHEAAVAIHGHTLAVLAHGLHTIVPKTNMKLAWLSSEILHEPCIDTASMLSAEIFCRTHSISGKP